MVTTTTKHNVSYVINNNSNTHLNKLRKICKKRQQRFKLAITPTQLSLHISTTAYCVTYTIAMSTRQSFPSLSNNWVTFVPKSVDAI